MNCPVCNSEIAPGTKYCPACGSDVEGAMYRDAGDVAVDPTVAMPSYAPAAYEPSATYESEPVRYAPPVDRQATEPYRREDGAVPMRSSMPATSAARSINTDAIKPGPKWPYVVIILLLVAIVALVVVLFKPWEMFTGSTTQTGTTTQDTPATTVVQPADGGTTTVVDQGGAQDAQTPTAEAATDNTAIFDGLNAAYADANGYDNSIASVAEDFNSYFTSDDASVRAAYAAEASSTLGAIDAQLASLRDMNVSADNVYYDEWNSMVELYECLSNRARVLSEAWNVSANAADPNDSGVQETISGILGADNGPGGVNVYKTRYNELYPQIAPVLL